MKSSDTQPEAGLSGVNLPGKHPGLNVVVWSPGGSSALPANLCPISRSILTGLWRIAADYLLHHADWKSRPNAADRQRLTFNGALRNHGKAISNEKEKGRPAFRSAPSILNIGR
jgi:hypothetical protein